MVYRIGTDLPSNLRLRSSDTSIAMVGHSRATNRDPPQPPLLATVGGAGKRMKRGACRTRL
jgi:hypothetical protein